MRERVQKIVYEAIEELNEELGSDELREAKEDTALFEALDSMAVLDFILAVEEKLEESFSKYVQIADERSMDASRTPFATVGSAIEYICERVRNG
jgi:acyl carrier protein